MSKAIGMVECHTISTGMQAADLMLKTAEVEILESQPVCPGKYIIFHCTPLPYWNRGIFRF